MKRLLPLIVAVLVSSPLASSAEGLSAIVELPSWPDLVSASVASAKALRSGLLVGSFVKGKWLDADMTVKRLGAKTKLRYALFAMGRNVGTASAGKFEQDPVDDTFGVTFDARPKKTKRARLIAVAGSAQKLALRPITKVKTTAAHKRLFKKILAQNGMSSNAAVQHLKTFAVDLDGDGKRELVLQGISDHFRTDISPDNARDDDYTAVALVRQQGNKRLAPTLVAGWFGSRQGQKDYPVPTVERLANALDFDGDGRLELVVDWFYYEGHGVNIYVVDPKGKVARRVLGAAAGL